MSKTRVTKKQKEQQYDKNFFDRKLCCLCEVIRKLLNCVFNTKVILIDKNLTIPMHENPDWKIMYPQAEFPWYHRFRRVIDWIDAYLNKYDQNVEMNEMN